MAEKKTERAQKTFKELLQVWLQWLRTQAKRLWKYLKKLWRSLKKVRWGQLRWDRIAVAALVILLVLFLLIKGLGALFSREESPDSQSQSDTSSSSETASEPETPAPQPATDLSVWNLRLINAQNLLPDGFTVATAALPNGLLVDERILPDLTQMIADAREQGVSLIVCSAYWDAQKQNSMYLRAVNSYLAQGMDQAAAEAAAAADVSVPGGSEHGTGLAVDIVTQDYQMLNEGYADTLAAQWLAANAPEYGFILRYPQNKADLTGILYQPWHFRYVGKEWARSITDSGLCFEEWVVMMQNGGPPASAESQGNSAGFGGGTAAPAQDDTPESDAAPQD